MRKGIARAATALLVVGLAGCGSDSSATTTTSGAPAATAATSAERSGPAAFGDTLTKDGVSVTVGAPAAFTPSSFAASGSGMGAGPSSLLAVTVANGTDKVLNPWAVNLTATSGDAQVGQVHDSANGVLAPTADILPGKTLVWKVAFESPPSKPLDVQVSVNFNRVGVYSKS